jgi:hypothetical protein
MLRRDPPQRIAALIEQNFQITVDREQMLACWNERHTRPTQTEPTQTERRQDKESMQFPADEAKEPGITLIACDAAQDAAKPPFSITPDPALAGGGGACEDEPAQGEAARNDRTPGTQTGRRQDEESLPTLPEDVVNPTRAARDKALDALADLARARLGLPVGPQAAPATDAQATQTGRRQDKKAPSVLTDEMKTFIVKGLARYETPTYVAAAVHAQFGVEIGRRQVFAYDPAGSRPPAQRWIDLHAATRAHFLQDVASIGIAQKVVRLRMLERYARQADEHNFTERAAKFLQQAARECGGFYERHARPKAAPGLSQARPAETGASSGAESPPRASP